MKKKFDNLCDDDLSIEEIKNKLDVLFNYYEVAKTEELKNKLEELFDYRSGVKTKVNIMNFMYQ